MPLLAILLPIHVVLAVALFLPSLLLPFALRTGRATADSGSRRVRWLLRLQGRGAVAIGLGLAFTGMGLVATLGVRLIEQPWLVVALAIYALTLGLAFFIQRPGLRAVLGVRAAWDDRAWLGRAVRLRYVSYAMATLVGVIGWLMSAKPALW